MSELNLTLKKQVNQIAIKGAAAAFTLLTIFGVIFYFYQDAAQNNEEFLSQEKRLKNQIEETRRNNDLAKETAALYEKLTQKKGEKLLDLNRKIISTQMNELSEKYLIQDIKIQIDPVTEHREGILARNSGITLTTKMTISFACVADSQAHAFTEELLGGFSGFINPKKYSLKRNGEISEALLESTVTSGKGNLITATLEFEWLGMKAHPTTPEGPKP